MSDLAELLRARIVEGRRQLKIQPTAGDLVVMALPEGEPPPPGWTMVPGGCWRIATGHETTLPFPWLAYFPQDSQDERMPDRTDLD